MDLLFVECGSDEWLQARAIRHEVFFRELGIGTDILDDDLEAHALHAVALTDGAVVGCGRLSELAGADFRISQMAVLPEYQRRGIGTALLARLVREAVERGADTIHLDARVSAAGFYARAGFQQSGDAFPSAKTGLPHVRMHLPNKRLNHDAALGDVDSAVK